MIINTGQHILFIFTAYSSGHLDNPDKKHMQAYLFEGLDYPVLLSPNIYGESNELVSLRPLLLKNHAPWSVMAAVEIAAENKNYLHSNEAQSDIFWLCRNYIFALNRKLFSDNPVRVFQPRYYIEDWRSNFWRYATVFDDNRVVADQPSIVAVRQLQSTYVDELSSLVSNSNVKIANYAQTTLEDELTSYFIIEKETHKIFIPGLINQDISLLKSSSLIGNVTRLHVNEEFNKSLLGFHFDGVKLPSSEAPGNAMLEFKNLYNILESQFDKGIIREMDALKKVLKDLRIKRALRQWLIKLKGMYRPENSGAYPIYNAEQLGATQLQKIVPSSPDLMDIIAERIYIKRCAIVHSKAYANQKIVPGSPEEGSLGFDLTLLRYMSDRIISRYKS